MGIRNRADERRKSAFRKKGHWYYDRLDTFRYFAWKSIRYSRIAAQQNEQAEHRRVYFITPVPLI
jgi:hypothetical protein